MRETRETIERGGRVVRPAPFLGMSRMTKMRRRAPTLSAAVFGALAAILLLAFPATEPAAAAFPGVNGKIVLADYSDVYSMNPDGSGLRQLTTQNAVSDRDPQWSPDGTKVAFLSERDKVADPDWGDFAAEIYVMKADGTNARRITNNATAEGPPTWSPNGAKLAYTREGQGGGGDVDVYTINPDGTGETRITDFADFSNPSNPVWSPDGTKIALEMYPGDDSLTFRPGVFVMDADGFGLKRLSEDFGEEPEWSPNGAKIAYAVADYDSSTGSTEYKIRTMNADGSAKATLSSSSYHNATPEWSPDGEKVAFLQGFCWPDGSTCLTTVNPDGSGTIIADSPTIGRLTPGRSGLDWGGTAPGGCVSLARVRCYDIPNLHGTDADVSIEQFKSPGKTWGYIYIDNRLGTYNKIYLQAKPHTDGSNDGAWKRKSVDSYRGQNWTNEWQDTTLLAVDGYKFRLCRSVTGPDNMCGKAITIDP